MVGSILNSQVDSLPLQFVIRSSRSALCKCVSIRVGAYVVIGTCITNCSKPVFFIIHLFYIVWREGQGRYELLTMVGAGGTRTCVHPHVSCRSTTVLRTPPHQTTFILCESAVYYFGMGFAEMCISMTKAMVITNL